MTETNETGPRSLGERLAERVILIAFCLSILGIAGMGVLAFYAIARTDEGEAMVLHTVVALAEIEQLHQAVVEAESAGRAFLVTGDPSFRRSYEEKVAAIDNELRDMRQATVENKKQQDLAGRMEPHINRRFAWLSGQMELRAAKGPDALRLSTIGLGVEEMKSISTILGQMKAEERRLLAERTAVRDRRNELLELSMCAAIIFSVAIFCVIFGYMNRLWKLHRKAEEKATYLSLHDTLTELPNRRLLQDRLAMGIARARRYNQKLAVLCLDLDGFKLINDTYGHDGGDKLLRLVAARLETLLRSEDTVARMGGDEFVVMLPQISDRVYGTTVAQKIIEHISAPYNVGGSNVSIGTSVGIAIFPEDGAGEEDLLKRADSALYEAKRLGKGRYAFMEGAGFQPG